MTYDMSAPWNVDVRGTQVLPLINEDGGCIKVEAGPGTGKTFGLRRRVLRLLLPEGLAVSHKSVLVVAFNRVIARNLRSEISEALTSRKYEGKFPRISTLHGFCLDTLGLEFRVLLPHEVEAMAYDVVTLNARLKEKYPRHSAVMTAIRLQDAGREDDPLLRDQIVKWLKRHKAGTISDIPGELLSAMKGGEHEYLRFDHILVDEFQDLKPSEQELVFRLTKPSGTVVALGDPRQSIYRFRGNDMDGLRKLESLTAMPVQECQLTVCQRCPNRFVDAANVTMVSSDAAPLEYGSDATDNTHLVHWKTPISEAKGMAKAIVENVRAWPGQDHLAMVTRRRFGYMLRDEIRSIDDGLTVRLVFSESPLETWTVREAFLAYCLLTDPDGPTWRAWLGYRAPSARQTHKAQRRNSVSYLKLLDSQEDNITMATMASVISGDTSVEGQGQSFIRERAARIISLQDKWSDKRSSPEDFVTTFFDLASWQLYETESEDMVTNDFQTIRCLALDLLSEETFGDAESRLKKTTAKLRTHIAVRDTETVEDEDVDVTIATLWSAKGVTSDNVYVLGLCQEAIPGTARDDYPGTEAQYDEEQQRLFYVTLTRSTRTLVLSRALKVTWSDAFNLSLKVDAGSEHHADLHISQFLNSVINELPQSVPGDSWPGCI